MDFDSSESDEEIEINIFYESEGDSSTISCDDPEQLKNINDNSNGRIMEVEKPYLELYFSDGRFREGKDAHRQDKNTKEETDLNDDILVKNHRIQITRRDINTLYGKNWLNDNIINFYLQMIARRSNRNGLKIYATSTFFYPKMVSSGHPAVKRWTKKIDIFNQDLILMPIYLGKHWCLAVVDFRKPGVYYYDSMGGNNMQCLATIKKYLSDEYKEKKGGVLDTQKFETKIMKNIPKQMNGSDCGIFTCKFADCIARDTAITFKQEDMPYFRKMMIWEIVQDTQTQP